MTEKNLECNYKEVADYEIKESFALFAGSSCAPVCGGVSTDLQLQPLLQLSEPESSSKIEAETRRDLDCVTAPNRHIALVAVVERRELEQREASFSFSVTPVYAIQMEK